MNAQQSLKDLEDKWSGGIFTADQWIGVIYPAVFRAGSLTN
jgi:hypothetical protein